MENLEKHFPNVSCALNPSFYGSFYNLSMDEKQLREHFNTVGVEKHLIPNADMFAEIMAKVLNFNLEVYISNVSVLLNGNLIGGQNSDTSLSYFLTHFYGSDGTNGQLVTTNIGRMTNSCELMAFNMKWDTLYANIYKHFKFDPDYYAFLNKIDNGDRVFEQWISNDLFAKKYPNLDSFNAQSNLIAEMSTLLHSYNVDLNYIVSEYGPRFKDKSDELSKFSDVERPMYIFFKYAKSCTFFWNKSDRDSYIEEHKSKYDAAIAFLKGMNFYDEKAIQAIKSTNASKLSDIIKQAKLCKLSVQVSKITLKDLASSLKLLKKLTNKTYIANFKLVNQLSDNDVLHQMLTTVLTNIVRVSNVSEFNSMTLKSFVLSFMYNAHLDVKAGMSKADFMLLVKTKTVSFVSDFLKSMNLESVDATCVAKDIEYLLEHKQIIKFVKWFVRIALLFA